MKIVSYLTFGSEFDDVNKNTEYFHGLLQKKKHNKQNKTKQNKNKTKNIGLVHTNYFRKITHYLTNL